MSIEFNCKTCGKHFKVAEAMAGKRGVCNGCGGIIEVSAPRRSTHAEAAVIGTDCPSCHSPLLLGAIFCVACGFDTRKGATIASGGTSNGATETPGEEREIKWWIMILIGISFIPLAFYEYNDLRKWESEGGTRYLDHLTAFAYSVFGTTGVLVLVLALSAVMIGGGILVRVLERKKPKQAASPLKDLGDAVVALKSPLTKLVLVGLVLVNLSLILALCTFRGFDRYDISNWFSSIFFGALALSLAEWSLWDRLIRRFDENHKPHTLLQIGGAAACLLIAVGLGYQTHLESQPVLDRQRTDTNHPLTRGLKDDGDDIGPAIKCAREIIAAREAKSSSGNTGGADSSNTTNSSPATAEIEKSPPTPAETSVRDEPGPAWQPDTAQLFRLGKEVTVDDYAVRPPTSFHLQAQSAKGNFRWISANGAFSIAVTERRDWGFHPPIITIPNPPLASAQPMLIGAIKDIGTIGGIPFVRARKAGTRMILYAAYDGNKMIVISCFSKEPDDLLACDAAARTFRPSSGSRE